MKWQAAQSRFYMATQTAQDQLDDLFWATFQVGDELQRRAVDLFMDAFTLQAFTPHYVDQLIANLARQTQETGRVLIPSRSSSLAWLELRNKYEVYNLVKHVAQLLNVPRQGEFPLDELVQKAYALGEYPDLWAVEGLGHDFAAASWKPPEPLRELLAGARARLLPSKSLTMMHAGLGLAIAERLLKTITPYSPAAEIRCVVEEFIRLCRDNSRIGYIGAAYESLGLVTRTWHPQMMALIDSALQETAPEAEDYFWHGAGRALYFLPFHFVPGSPSPWFAVGGEALSRTSLMNMRAGLTWATTLVNLRQPEVIAHLLKSQGKELTQDDAFTNGVMSSLIMAYDTTPGDTYIMAFRQYRPVEVDPAFSELWNDFVVHPLTLALDNYYPILKRHDRLGEVFHYGSLAELVRQMERG